MDDFRVEYVVPVKARLDELQEQEQAVEKELHEKYTAFPFNPDAIEAQEGLLTEIRRLEKIFRHRLDKMGGFESTQSGGWLQIPLDEAA